MGLDKNFIDGLTEKLKDFFPKKNIKNEEHSIKFAGVKTKSLYWVINEGLDSIILINLTYDNNLFDNKITVKTYNNEVAQLLKEYNKEFKESNNKGIAYE